MMEFGHADERPIEVSVRALLHGCSKKVWDLLMSFGIDLRILR